MTTMQAFFAGVGVMCALAALALAYAFLDRKTKAPRSLPTEPVMFRMPDGRVVPIDDAKDELMREAGRAPDQELIDEIAAETKQRRERVHAADTANLEARLLASEGALCQECKHFDIAGGQELLRRNPAAFRAMEIIPPSEYGRTMRWGEQEPCPDCAPTSKDPCNTCHGQRMIQEPLGKTPSHYPVRARWVHFGICGRGETGDLNAPTSVLYGGYANCEGRLFQVKLRSVS